ncbi:MAG: ribosome biogenesis GTP-binding protein YihA/YsxC [Polyangia bacterium]
MKILSASFLTSATSATQWPPAVAPDGTRLAEVAVCGRSNVGKSTLLNALLGRRGLARVSGTPGRTRLINFFGVTVLDERPGRPAARPAERIDLRVADLPGFGYAQVSKHERASWRPMMEEYLLSREPLRVVILLCDSRRAVEPDAAELLYSESEIAHFLRDHGRLVVPVLTKADKLSKHERKPAAEAAARLIEQRVTPVCAQSGPEGDGMAELWRRVLSALRTSGAPPETRAPSQGLGAG